MKRITLLIAIFSISLMNAQIKLDFESILDQNIGSNTDKVMAFRTDNPNRSGINISRNAIKVVEFAGAEYWSSAIVDKFNSTISLYDGRYFSIDFFSSKEKGMITLKFQNGIEKDFVYSGKPNTWRRAVFNFSDFPEDTNSVKIDIFFDVRDHKNPKKLNSKNQDEESFWFDNITQSKRRIRKK